MGGLSSFKKAYLVLYNTASAAIWAIVFYNIVLCLVGNSLPADLNDLKGRLSATFEGEAWIPNKSSFTFLTKGNPVFLWEVVALVQFAAVMEVIHAATGLVRSPVVVTFMQVLSRVGVLGMAMMSSREGVARNHWAAGVMLLAWSMVEVPRYLFYVCAIITGDATKKTPYSLFWLRYSLFAVLYPMGISGECLTMWNLLSDLSGGIGYSLSDDMGAFMRKVITCVLVIYIPGGPFMFMNMVGNRKSAFRKRFAKPRPPPKGLLFPTTDDKGTRSTSAVGKNVLAAAVGAVNAKEAEKIKRCRNWRFGYNKFFCRMVELQCESKSAALKVAEAGLAYCHENFEFVQQDGTSSSFAKAMKAKNKEKFGTGKISGTKEQTTTRLEVPYKGSVLYGDKLIAQVNAWVSYGTIEKSAGDAIINCVKNDEWLDLSDKYFVLLGAGSAMGPFLVLLALGANIVAVDLDRPGIWKRLISLARDSPGTITFPIKGGKSIGDFKGDDELFAACGCNLFTETPLTKDWLLGLYPKEEFVVGSYAYLDGALHVQVSLAMDAICKELSEKRGATLAYLCTPTDAHLVPAECNKAALREYNRMTFGKLFELIWQTISMGKFLVRNAPDGVNGFNYVDGIAVAQGPNYALAKRIQHWRAIVAREAGCTVSSNIAPSTSTVSVTSNRTFAWAYEGMPYFRPYEIFAPETSKAVMLALLTNDIRNKESVANPDVALSNPNELFKWNSFHGGVWRSAYTVSTIGEVSVFIYFSKTAIPYLGGLLGIMAALYTRK